DRILGLADFIAHELEREQLAGIRNRKHPAENLLESLVLPARDLDVHLEEVTEALELDLEQIRNLQIPLAIDLAEALPFLTARSLQGLPAFLSIRWGSVMHPTPKPRSDGTSPRDVPCDPGRRRKPTGHDVWHYLISTVAPCSSSFAL